ncbi:MAG TPA: hypothetical protein VJ652_10150 [Noviherbaspirillum sp.]|nr:hypothetical protein [Noviherbaspirillum sp.]
MTIEEGTLMEPMLNRTARIPFTPADAACLRSRFAAPRMKRRHIYDLELLGAPHEGTEPDALRKGVVIVGSRNLGYDFKLIHVGAGRGVFGAPRTAVRIYVGKRGSGRYALLTSASSLARALAVIDRIYAEAAERHLP